VELSWSMKLRIAAAAAVGFGLIGILAWPLVAPAEPLGIVSVFDGGISFGDVIILAALAILVGFVAYFSAWPYGREIGILAVPFGLAIWAVRSGSVAGLIQINPMLAQRQALFTTLKWEPVLWLAIVAAGFFGVLLAEKIYPAKRKAERPEANSYSNSRIYLNAAIGLVGSLLIAQICIGIFAQNVRVFDSKLGSVLAQPAVSQIVFAVLVSFGIAGFVVKKFLNVGYIWVIIASALVTGFGISTYVKQDILQYLVGHWPAGFFSNAVTSILPVQMVAFGALGSIAGYWLAVQYNYWRREA